MVPLHLNANRLALALHVPDSSIYDVAKEERGISREMALRPGQAFGTIPDSWLSLRSEFDLRVVRSRKGAPVKNQARRLKSTHRFSPAGVVEFRSER